MITWMLIFGLAEVLTERPVVLGDERFRRERINDFAFSPDGTKLALVGQNPSPMLFDVRTGRSIDPPGAEWDGRGSRVVFSPDGQELFVSDIFETNRAPRSRFYDVRTGHGTRDALAASGATFISPRLNAAICDQTFIMGIGDRFKLVPLQDDEKSTALNTWHSAYTFAFSPDGKVLAAGDRSGDVWLCDPHTGIPTDVIRIGDGPMHTLKWSPDGRTVASSMVNGLLQVTDLQSRRTRVVGAAPRSYTAYLAFAPDGKALACIDDRGRLQVIEFPSGRPRFCVSIYPPRIRGSFALSSDRIQFSPDGQLIAIMDLASGLRFFDARDGSEWNPRVGHNWEVQTLRFRADGRTLMSVDGNRVIVWDIPTRQPTKSAYVMAWPKITGDGQYVLDQDFREGYRVGSPGHARPLVGLTSQNGSAVSDDGDLVACWDVEGHYRVWRAGDRTLLAQGKLEPFHEMFGLHENEDGQITAGVRASGEKPQFVDLTSGKMLTFLPNEGSNHRRTADGTTLVYLEGGPEGFVIASRDLKSGETHKSPLVTGFFEAVTITPDGTMAAGITESGTVRVLEVASARTIRELQPPSRVTAIAIGHDTRTLALGGADGLIRLYDITPKRVFSPRRR